MRYAVAVAGLAASAQAATTFTVWDEVTITSCAPTHTNCAYRQTTGYGDAGWGQWDPAQSTTTPSVSTGTWGPWDPSKPSTKTTTTAPTGSWGPWDPSKPSTKTTTTAPTGSWGPWDPSKPSTSTKTKTKSTPGASTGTWGPWDASKSSTSTKTTPGVSTGTWGNWGPNDPSKSTITSTATNWNNWNGNGNGNGNGNNGGSPSSKTPAAASCPAYTATAPPAWFSQLPTSVLSSLAAQWTGGPPADWCYYSYTNGVVASTKTPDAASTGVGASGTWSAWADPSATGVKGTTTSSGPIASYTGAANANAASYFVAGAAAVAAVVLA